MTVVGIDFGNLKTVVAVARNKGIDIITNEVSNRLTPSLVCFAGKSRHLGESAKTMEVSNLANTVGSIRRLLGLPFDDPLVQQEQQFLACQLVRDPTTGQVAVKLTAPDNDAFSDGSHLERDAEGKVTVSMIQLAGMYLGHVKRMAEAALGRAVQDVVIDVPVYYTDSQRRALIDAASIAGLRVLRLVNDTTATALAYGIPKSELPDSKEKPRYVCLVDVGESDTQVAIVAFSKGRSEVKGVGYDRFLGGRMWDAALVAHFGKVFESKHAGLKITGKSLNRLRSGCERVKKILSSNAKTMLSIENLSNDIDVSIEVQRADVEEMWVPLFERLDAPVRTALAEAGLTPADIDAIETVGGTTRIPSVRARLQTLFPGKELSCTLNQDEAVARGAAFLCATLSPTFKVKEWTHVDTVVPSRAVRVSWDPIPEDPEDKELILFASGNPLPATKLISFEHREADFTVVADYASQDVSTGPSAVATIQGVGSLPKDALIKVKVRLSQDALLSFEQATSFVRQTASPSETDGASSQASDETPAVPTKTVWVKHEDLRVSVQTGSLPTPTLDRYTELECVMAEADKFIADTEAAKNTLEEYIYDMRSKLDGDLSEFVDAKTKDTFLLELNDMESWLYGDDGGHQTKSVYSAKLDSLTRTGQPITGRRIELDSYRVLAEKYETTCNQLVVLLSSTDAKHAHISPEDRAPLVQQVKDKQIAVKEALQHRLSLPKHLPVPANDNALRGFVTAANLQSSSETLVCSVSSVMNRPAPKPSTPKPAPKAEATSPDTAAPMTNDNDSKEGREGTPVSSVNDSSSNFEITEMDLD